MALRDASGLLEPVVRDALATLDLPESDLALVSLALAYARAIDRDAFQDEPSGELAVLGPKLHAVVESLLASPAARAKFKQATSDGPVMGADALRVLRGGA